MALIMSLSCLTACDFSSLLGGMGGGNSTSESVETKEESLEVLGEQETVTLKKDESGVQPRSCAASGKNLSI